MKNLYHSSFDRVADLEPLVREMQEYAHRVLVETRDPFGSCYGVQYKFTVFRTRIGRGLMHYDPTAYELARLFKETLNEARQKLNGARVFDVVVLIHDNPAEFDRVLEIRVKHAEIPQVVLVGVDHFDKCGSTIVAAQVAAAQQKAATNAQAGWAQPLAAPQPQVPAAPVPAFEAPACTEKPSRLLTD